MTGVGEGTDRNYEKGPVGEGWGRLEKKIKGAPMRNKKWNFATLDLVGLGRPVGGGEKGLRLLVACRTDGWVCGRREWQV